MNNIYVPTESPEDWKKLLAEPDKHWRKGYSARTLAYCWQNASGFPRSVKSVFDKSQVNLFRNLELLLAIPEHQVSLPGGRRPSQNDIWVLAKVNNELVSIAVEGKVSEPFGPTLGQWLQNSSPGKQERLKFLCEQLGLSMPLPESIRYQLLHRMASAIIEAKRFNAAYAMMLIHSFSKIDESFEDYNLFLALFRAKGIKNSVVALRSNTKPFLYSVWVGDEGDY